MLPRGGLGLRGVRVVDVRAALGEVGARHPECVDHGCSLIVLLAHAGLALPAAGQRIASAQRPCADTGHPGPLQPAGHLQALHAVADGRIHVALQAVVQRHLQGVLLDLPGGPQQTGPADGQAGAASRQIRGLALAHPLAGVVPAPHQRGRSGPDAADGKGRGGDQAELRGGAEMAGLGGAGRVARRARRIDRLRVPGHGPRPVSLPGARPRHPAGRSEVHLGLLVLALRQLPPHTGSAAQGPLMDRQAAGEPAGGQTGSADPASRPGVPAARLRHVHAIAHTGRLRCG